jgi:hypothetical protein
VASEKVKVPHYLDTDFLRSLSRKISNHALRIIKKEYDKAIGLNVLELCTNYHRNVLGLPHAHEIKQYLMEEKVLSLEDIHCQWYLERPEVSQLENEAFFSQIRDPAVVIGRGRPAGATNRSTRRDPSGFELAERRQEGRICGVCNVRGTGHNARTCPFRSSG